MDRSLAFTALLEWDEFRVLEMRLGELVTTELVAIYRANPTVSLWDHFLAYRDKHRGQLDVHVKTLAKEAA